MQGQFPQRCEKLAKKTQRPVSKTRLTESESLRSGPSSRGRTLPQRGRREVAARRPLRRQRGAERAAARRLGAAGGRRGPSTGSSAGRHGALAAQLVPSLCLRKEPPSPRAARTAPPPPGAHEPERALDAGAVLAEALPEPRQAEGFQPYLRAALRLRHGERPAGEGRWLRAGGRSGASLFRVAAFPAAPR